MLIDPCLSVELRVRVTVILLLVYCLLLYKCIYVIYDIYVYCYCYYKSIEEIKLNYFLGCIFFVFGTMVELAIVCFISKAGLNKKPITNTTVTTTPTSIAPTSAVTLQNGLLPSSSVVIDRSPLLLDNYMRLITRKPTVESIKCTCWSNTDQIDRFSAILFPFSFTLFNVFYWWYFLSQAYVLENSLLSDDHHIVG